MSHKQKLSIEEKVKLVRQCIQGEISIQGAAEKARVGRTSVRRWISAYEAEGAAAFLPHEKNRIYSPELKREAVLCYLSGEGSLLEISKKYKIRNPNILEAWIKVYNTHGNFNSVKQSGGGSYMRQTRSTTQEERIQIARECIASRKNYGELAIKYNVSYQQVYTWVKKFSQLGEAGLEDRRGKRTQNQEARSEIEELRIKMAKLEHELYMTKMERDLLKKLEELERGDAYRK